MDGLVKCLLHPGQLRNQPHKAMQVIFTHLSDFQYRDKSCCRDKVNGVASRRASCHGFCAPPGQLYRDMTNPTHLSGPRHLDNFIVTRNFRPSARTLQKRIPTLTLMATH
jgi:hypothetical protein